MHPISSANKENILSLASNGYSIHHIASKTGVGRSTVSRVLQNITPHHSIPSSGCPFKLSATSQHAIITQINTGRAENAVEVMQNLNSINSNESMPRRLEAVVKAKGGHTKY